MKKQEYKIGDRVKFTDKAGIERVGVVYEAGTLYSRVETYVGIGKIRDLETSSFQPATEQELGLYVETMMDAQSLKAVMKALDPTAIIEREKGEHPE